MEIRAFGAILVAIVAVAAAAPGIASADAPRQKVDALFTTQSPGVSSGRIENGDFMDPDNPGGKPHGVDHVVLQLAAGARFDTSAIPQCGASDAELMLQGPSACPDDTKIGQGPVVVDTGFDGQSRELDLDFTSFNTKDGLVLVGREQQSGAYLGVRGTLSGGTLTIVFPPAPGAPPEGGGLKRERITFFERTGSAPYLTTPPTCPASREWINRLTYTYRDGVTQTVESPSPCTPAPDRARPRVRVRGVPHRCVTRGFTTRIAVADESSLRRVTVSLDGRRIATTTRKGSRARVHAAALGRGRHRLHVTATDGAGNSTARTVRFRRC